MRSLQRIRLVSAAATVAAMLAGCGSSGHHSSAGSGSAGTQVTATESEFKIQLSRQSFSPGTYTFVAKNAGQLSHSLEINGPGVSNRRIRGTFAPGQSKKLTVTLQKGMYDIFCPVPGHKQDGMDVHIQVGGASGGGGTTTTNGGGGNGGY